MQARIAHILGRSWTAALLALGSTLAAQEGRPDERENPGGAQSSAEDEHGPDWYDPSEWIEERLEGETGVERRVQERDDATPRARYGGQEFYGNQAIYEAGWGDRQELDEYEFDEGDYAGGIYEHGVEQDEERYEWNPLRAEWELETVPDEPLYEGDLEYGLHWEWDERSREWVRDYGHYDPTYAFARDPEPGTRERADEPRDGREAAREPASAREPARENGRESERRSESSRSARARYQEQVQGRVVEIHRMAPGRAGGEPHVLVQLETPRGERPVVDLGPRVRQDVLGLEKGDQVITLGRTARIRGKKIFVARRFSVAEPSARVHAASFQPGRTAGGARGGASASDRHGLTVIEVSGPVTAEMLDKSARTRSEKGSASLRGRVQEVRPQDGAELHRLPADHNLVTIELKDGARWIVDLGPRLTSSALGLETGDAIWIEGREHQASGREVLRAETIRIADASQVKESPASASKETEKGSAEEAAEQQSESSGGSSHAAPASAERKAAGEKASSEKEEQPKRSASSTKSSAPERRTSPAGKDGG